jgi:photosystem II stability/assembly factor-like uncharacterized protein
MTFAQNYGWTDISAYIPGTPDLSDVFFISDNEGWITSSSHAEIYHTTDGGETFEIQETSLGTATEAIYMIDSANGFCGGGSGFVYNTGDGGNNWGFLGAMSSTLADLDFVSASQGYACGDHGAVYSISGGVTNLNSGLASNLAGISAPSVDNVWVCGGGTISYYNGTSFSFQSGPVGSYNSIFFISIQEGWVVGNSGLIGHTINGGNTWTRQTNPSSNSLYDVFFLNTEVGWAVGFNGTILSTANGGDTWTIQGAGLTTAFLRGVHFVSTDNGNVGYVVGNGKTLLKYTGVLGIGDERIPVDFELFPNPVNENLYIKCSDFKTESGTIEILSIDGKEVLKREIRQGNENIEIDLDKHEAGMYLCQITIGNRSTTKKIIKE